MPGRIATPENILSSIAFVDSVIQPGSYQRNDTYRLLTKEEGFLQVQEHWLPKLLERLKENN